MGRLTAVVAVSLAAATAAPASAHTRVQHCGWVYPSHADAAMVRESGTSCRLARRAIRYYGDHLRALPGWRCRPGPYPNAVLVCRRGRATATASVAP